MKIFWTASFHGKSSYQKNYNLISRIVDVQPGLEVVATEKGNYLDLVPPTIKARLNGQPLKLHYEAIRRGILWADAVIIEMSHEDFQLGHEATLAIQAKKHVLCLSVHEDFSQKIDHRHFHGAKYNRSTIEEQVENFLTFAQKDLLSHRFNLFLTSSQEQFLKSKGQESGQGASNYLRSLIDFARNNP
ncbi:MAG: hypothetical protein ACD_40C00059G0001 [uncultured bacterium]|nr:MAG: hypothetical protein ACD_40C00059G0001 [uncultured bacterium]